MHRLILEHIIRRILQEGEFTNLGVTSFHARPSRIDTFVKYLQSGTAIPLTKGNSAKIKSVEVIKKDKSKLNFTDFKGQEQELKTTLDDLKPGDKMYLTDFDNQVHNISTVVKTSELGGLGKGVRRGDKSEKAQATTIKSALANGPVDLTVIDVTGKSHTLEGVSDFVPVGGNKKADFKFTTAEGDVYVQTKDEKHQQLEGVVRSNFAKDEQGRELIRELGRKTKEAIQSGRLRQPVVVPIEDERLQRLAIYGTADETVPSNPSAVTMYLIGNVKVESNTLTANKIYYYPYIPENDPPVLAATYRGGRNQRMPGEKESLADVRLGVYFKSYIPSPK